MRNVVIGFSVGAALIVLTYAYCFLDSLAWVATGRSLLGRRSK